MKAKHTPDLHNRFLFFFSFLRGYSASTSVIMVCSCVSVSGFGFCINFATTIRSKYFNVLDKLVVHVHQSLLCTVLCSNDTIFQLSCGLWGSVSCLLYFILWRIFPPSKKYSIQNSVQNTATLSTLLSQPIIIVSHLISSSTFSSQPIKTFSHLISSLVLIF